MELEPHAIERAPGFDDGAAVLPERACSARAGLALAEREMKRAEGTLHARTFASLAPKPSARARNGAAENYAIARVVG